MEKIILIVTFFFSLIIYSNGFAEEDEDDIEFFLPARPKNVKLNSEVGTLETIEGDVKSIEITLRLPNGRLDYLIFGKNFFFLEKGAYNCGLKGVLKKCSGETEVRLEKPKVKATYWYQKRYGLFKDTDGITRYDYNRYSIQKVTDRIELVK